MSLNAHCHVLLRKPTSYLDPWDSVNVKNGVTYQELDQEHQKYRWNLKMGLNAHCRVLLRKPTLDLDPWDSVNVKNGKGHKKYKWNLKMSLNAHCRVLLRQPTSDLDPWDSVDVKNGVTCQDYTKDTWDTNGILKWVLMRIAAFCYTSRPQI